jgi:hypothetical protein
LPAPIDAIKKLQKHLQDKTVTDAPLDAESGDLLFEFSDNIKFRVFNFTGYEVWEIHFPDGALGNIRLTLDERARSDLVASRVQVLAALMRQAVWRV